MRLLTKHPIPGSPPAGTANASTRQRLAVNCRKTKARIQNGNANDRPRRY